MIFKKSNQYNFMRPRGIVLYLLGYLLSGCQLNVELTPLATILPEDLSPSITSTPTVSVFPSNTAVPALEEATPDLRSFTIKSRKADVWDAPENENKYLHLETQLVLGEKVLVIGIQGEWANILAVEQPAGMDSPGYPGWVRTDKLVQGWQTAEQYVIVMSPHSYIHNEPDGNVLMSVYLDTRLPVESTRLDWVQIRLPDGKLGWLRSDEIRLTDDMSAPIPTEDMVDLARKLIGVPYLWGGTTTDSLDCSGLFYRVFHAYGRTLSRDADDLALGGNPVAREDLKEGDMIFTSSEPGGPIVHVAMYLGNDSILDATDYYGVFARSIREFLHDNFWVSARRYLP